MQGVEPTHVQQGEEAVGVRVVLAHPGQTLDQNLLPDILVASPVTGGNIPLSEVATVQILPGASQVTRENQRQMIAVTASLYGRDLGSATPDIQAQIRKQVTLPPGYTVEYGGLYASQQQSFSELGTTLLIDDAVRLHPAGLPVPLDPPGHRPAAGRPAVPVRRPAGPDR